MEKVRKKLDQLLKKAAQQDKTPAEILKMKKKFWANAKQLRSDLRDEVERNTDRSFKIGVLPQTKIIREQSRVVDQLILDKNNNLKKHINNYFRSEKETIWAEIAKMDLSKKDAYRKAKEKMKKFYKKRREVYTAFLGAIFASLALDARRKKRQLDVPTFIKSFEKIMKTLGLIKSFKDLVEISNAAKYYEDVGIKESDDNEPPNRAFEIYKKLNKNRESIKLSEKDREFLGKKYIEYRKNNNKTPKTNIEKYEKLALPLIFLALPSKERILVAQKSIENCSNAKEAIWIIKDWLISDLLTTMQAVELTQNANAKFRNSPYLKKFTRDLITGKYKISREQKRQILQRQINRINMPLAKVNFALSTMNISTLLLYELVFHGALIGVMGGLFSGALRAFHTKNIDDLIGIMSHPTFLGCLGAVGISSEYFTSRKFGVEPGAVSKLLRGKGGKKAREYIKAQKKRELFVDMSNRPYIAEFIFLKHYSKIDKYLQSVTKGDPGKIINPQKVFSKEKLQKLIAPSPLPDFVMRNNDIGFTLHLWWHKCRYDYKLKNADSVRDAYKKELKKQGLEENARSEFLEEAGKVLKELKRKTKKS